MCEAFQRREVVVGAIELGELGCMEVRVSVLSKLTKKPLPIADLERIVAALLENLLDCRDAALLLVGFTGAFRRSGLVALNWQDVEPACTMMHSNL